MREALAADAVLETFATPAAAERHPELAESASLIAERDAVALSETVTPQGLVAVCRIDQPSLSDLLDRSPRLLVHLVEPNNPGNLGTIVRVADAAGADAVLLTGGVDPYNGKAIRAGAGSVFHLPVIEAGAVEIATAAGAAGLSRLATSGSGADDLDDLVDAGTLARPTMWVFGTEAHGLPADVLAGADRTVRIPIHGRAESLNVAAATAVCLYASARAQRR